MTFCVRRMKPFTKGAGREWVLLESRRNGDSRKARPWRRQRRRGIGVALPAGEGALAPGARAWSRGGDESPVYGATGGRVGQRERGDAEIPVSVHGGRAAGSRRARSTDSDGRGCSASGGGGGSWVAVVGGWQVHGRTNDFAGRSTASTGWGARTRVLWLSAAPAQPDGNETSRPPWEGFDTDAVPAGNARCTCRSQVVASDLRKARDADEVARH